MIQQNISSPVFVVGQTFVINTFGTIVTFKVSRVGHWVTFQDENGRFVCRRKPKSYMDGQFVCVPGGSLLLSTNPNHTVPTPAHAPAFPLTPIELAIMSGQ
jgi:hypothetical protein